MVSKILKFLNRESSGVNEAALLLGLFTFLSQILGLVRDRLLATYLGAGSSLDLYYAAFKIPDFLYVSVATLAAITVMLPYLSERFGSGDSESAQRTKAFFNQVFTALFGFLAVLSVILFILMPLLVHLIAPGFSVAEHAKLVMMSRIMLLQPIIVGVSNLFSSVTQMFRKFFVAALSPVMYNLGIILGVLIFLPIFGVMGLAYGVVLGAVLHLVIQLPVLGFHGFIPKFVRRISWKDIKSIILVSVPRTIGLSISSFTAVILTSLASNLATGSIAIFNLTNNMLNVPIGIIGISYSVASFPVLVKLFQSNERSKFADHIVEATRKIILLAAPITVLFIVLRAQIIRVILGAHSFSWNDTRIAAACLALFVLGMVCEALVYLLVRGYYAIGNTKTPLIWNFIGEIITVILAVIFVWMFRHIPSFGHAFSTVLRLDGVPNLEILALPFAFSIGNILNFFTLWYVFVRDFPDAKIAPVWKTAFEATAASVGLGIASYATLQLTAHVFNQATFWGIFGQGIASGAVGVIAAIVVLRAMGNRDIVDISRAMRRKFWKASVVQEVGEAVDS
ncbi:MAG: hypothetical protein JWM20_488 [Patescibacteria group bacterium]|nr:hypothetical protein [Patescibacteria group bacterium]